MRYKNNKFLTNHLDNFLTWNLLFLYLTNEVEFGQDILQDCISSYHLHVWFFLGEFRRLFFRGLHGFSQSCGLHQICSQLSRCHELELFALCHCIIILNSQIQCILLCVLILPMQKLFCQINNTPKEGRAWCSGRAYRL